jgi:ubiquinone/menaquinone biosynthesis C-methylase UbiE
MSQSNYIFTDAAGAHELKRLQLLESVFDPKTREWLSVAGPLSGLRCLEVGAGAGSIASWLSAQVGPRGNVTAVDSNVRFLPALGRNVHVIQGDFGACPLPAEPFDRVHARYVLIHNANSEALLARMLSALKPGGLILLEEPDFSAGRVFVAPLAFHQAFENVKRAAAATFAERGMDYAFGLSLPALAERAGARVVSLEYDCAVQPGASALAEMMRLSALSLQDKYLNTGCVSAQDIAHYAELASTPTCWTNFYATVRVLLSKPAV